MQSLDIPLFLSLGLFTIGVVGILIRKNPFFLLLSIELMLNGAMLAFVAFSRVWANVGKSAEAGHLFVFFIIAIATIQAAVGIGLVTLLYRRKKGNIGTESWASLRG